MEQQKKFELDERQEIKLGNKYVNTTKDKQRSLFL